MDRLHAILLTVAVMLAVSGGGAMRLHQMRVAQAAASDAQRATTSPICRTCHEDVQLVALRQDDGDEQEGDEEANIPRSTADHSQYDILQQDFASGPEVTEACLTCHTEADVQLHATIHWNWEFEHPETGQLLGKRHVINNTTLSIASNVSYCATCHNGYGLSGDDFDFSASNNIDCLSCHDTTGDYEKLPGAAGHPAYEPTEYPPGSGQIWQPPDLTFIAQSVGPTSRQSCGSCHFGEQNVDPVIHGKLPQELLTPDHALDVHMNVDELNFSCSTCHQPQQHQFFSSQYWPVSMREDVPGHLVHATCSTCHDPQDVHANETLNQHTDRVACQSCHIPTYARSGPTMTLWDWSKTGRTENGQPVVERNEADLLAYDSRMGAFEWGENLVPEYAWSTGIFTYTKVGDPIDPSQTVVINQVSGSYEEPNAKLWPFKHIRGIQPYDLANNYLVAVNLHGSEEQGTLETALWETLDWEAAIRAGMEAEGVPYSGAYGFVETRRYWPLNHTVAPADQAVGCGACHSRNGRLAGVEGGYIPGRDYSFLLDIAGWILVAGTLVAVGVHTSLRVVRGGRS